MTLTDHIENFLRSRLNGAITAEIKQYCKDIDYINKAQNEIKNISGICSHKCIIGEWFKRDMGRYCIWSIYPF